MIPSKDLQRYSLEMNTKADQPAAKNPDEDVADLRQWVSNLLKVVADLTYLAEVHGWSTVSGAPEVQVAPETPAELEAVSEGATVVKAVTCPSCGGGDVHKTDCPVAAYLRQTGYVNPNVSALKDAVLAMPNPPEIPRCPECGVGGGHATTCSVVQNAARAQGLLPEEML